MTFSAHHCAVNVADLDEAVAFYRDDLGLDVLRQWETGARQGTIDGLADRDDVDVDETEARVAYLAAGDGYVELVCYRTPRGADANERLRNDAVGRVHVCFTVPDLRSAYRSLGDRVEFVSRPVMTSSGGLMAKCYDPSGTLVELMEPPDPPAGDGLVSGLSHYGINTNDLDAAIAFFREAFGWEPRTRFSPPGAVDEFASGLPPGAGVSALAFLDAGRFEIELLAYPDAPNENGSMAENDVGRPHLGVQVDDCIGAHGSLAGAVRFLSPPQTSPLDAVIAKCRAHEGYTVELIEPPDWLP